jgi:hypothetical protein
VVATRPAGQERTTYSLATMKGGKLRFDNDAQETPLQEVWAYNIQPGTEPQGVAKLSYTVRASMSLSLRISALAAPAARKATSPMAGRTWMPASTGSRSICRRLP